MQAAIYLEWAIAPTTWAVAFALANAAVALGLGGPGRPLRRAAALTMAVGSALLLLESSLRPAVPGWQALAGGRLGLELLGLVAGITLTWVLRERSLPRAWKAKLGRLPAIAVSLAFLATTFALALTGWPVPPSLRSSLSLAREQAEERPAPQSVRSLFDLITALVLLPRESGELRELQELLGRSGDGPRAIASLLQSRGPDGSPARDGTLALIALLGDCRASTAATAELERWLRWEQAMPDLRARAAFQLAMLGDEVGVAYAADLYARTLSDPAWQSSRGELSGVVARSPSAEARAGLRAALRSRSLSGNDLILPFETLLGSNAVEDRAATLDFFLDENRFGKLSIFPDLRSLNAPIAPLMSDLLEDDDPLVRERACKRLVGDEPQARQFRADLWDEVHGYPCRRLQRASVRAQVAAAIRRSLGLGLPRPPLPDDARLAPLPDDASTRARASTAKLDDYFGELTALAVSPDATVALTAAGSSTDEWLLGSRRHFYSLTMNGADSLAFLPGEPTAIAWTGKYGANAYDTETGERVRAFPPCAEGPPPSPPAIQASRRPGAGAVSPDGALVATGGDDLCVWDRSDGTLVLRRPVCPASDDVGPVAAAFSPDGRTLFVACRREVLWVSPRGAHGATTLGSIAEPSEGLQWAGPMVALEAEGDKRLLIAERSSGPAQNDRVSLWSTTAKGPLWSIDLGSHGAPARPAMGPCNRASITPYIPGFGAGMQGPWVGPRPGVVGYGLPPAPCTRVGTPARSNASNEGPPMALSSDHERLLVGGRGLCLWRMSDGQLARCLVAPDEAEVTAVAWGPNDAFAIEAERALASTVSPAAAGPPHRVREWKGDTLALH